MTAEELKKLKRSTLEELRARLPEYRERIEGTDEGLWVYVDSVSHNSEDYDIHNTYEILAVKKFLRLLDTYEWRPEEARKFFKMYEKLKFNGLSGRQRYRLTPIQRFQFASIFGFYREDGTRLCRQAILFVPRKFGKTTGVASLALHDLIFGDSNAQAYMAANSETQSGICFRELKQLILQLDPDGKIFRVTANEINWRTPNQHGKEGLAARLTAGGRTKDGLAASLVIYDEYAAARYVKEHSDGAELLNVLTSSMGTRRQPLTVIITTANRVIDGPFEQMLNDAKDALITGDNDWQFASIFCPDPWENEESDYADPRVWLKCNPHIGITIQPGFYAEEYEQARRNPEKMKEFRCKYLNVFQSDTVRDWITADDIRRLQADYAKIEHLPTHDEAGNAMELRCIVTQDFSRGDDLCAQTYLCTDGDGHYFFDCDAWITEETLETHPNHRLYKRWAEDGWLRVCPGRVIDERMVTDRIAEINEEHCPIIAIGYDPYDSSRFVTAEKELIFAMGGDPNQMVRPVRQTNGAFNASTQAMEHLIKVEPQMCWFSPNPVIAWCFGNCVLDVDKNDNVKPIKRSVNQKVDVAQCACACIQVLSEFLQTVSK